MGNVEVTTEEILDKEEISNTGKEITEEEAGEDRYEEETEFIAYDCDELEVKEEEEEDNDEDGEEDEDELEVKDEEEEENDEDGEEDDDHLMDAYCEVNDEEEILVDQEVISDQYLEDITKVMIESSEICEDLELTSLNLDLCTIYQNPHKRRKIS